MTFFEFVSVVQKHFKNCEIRTAQFDIRADKIQSIVRVKPDSYKRFTQVAAINGCKQEALRYGDNRVVFAFELEGVRFICDVSELESVSC